MDTKTVKISFRHRDSHIRHSYNFTGTSREISAELIRLYRSGFVATIED